VLSDDSLNPDRPTRFDASAAIGRLRRVVLLAPSLAVLLVLAAAGAASAADGLDLVDAAPLAPVVPSVGPSVDPKAAVAPIVAGLTPVKDRAVKAAPRALPNRSGQSAGTTLRGARGTLDAVVPVPLRAVMLAGLSQVPGRVARPSWPHPSAADRAEPAADLPSGITTSLAADQAVSLAANEAQQLNSSLPLGPLQPAPPLAPSDPAGASPISESGTGLGPWLGHGPPPPIRPFWRSGVAPAIPFAMPHGRTPRYLVPPG
jgi:hypothetical protein